MIDQYKLYVKIDWIIFFIFTLISMLIMINTNIEVKELVNGFFIIKGKHIVKYIVITMPLILSYTFVRMINKWLYRRGYYYKLIKKYKSGKIWS